MQSTETRASLISQAEGLLRNTPFTREHSAKFDALMALHGALGTPSDEFRKTLASAERSLESERHEALFRSYVRTGDASELRTYSPMAEGTGSLGGFTVPEQWAATYSQRLVSASGLLAAGATLKELKTGRKYLSFFSDDSASQAEVLGENQQLSSAANPVNPVASVFSPTLSKFASSTVVSNEELQDAAFDIDGYLANLFAQRVARKSNATMTTAIIGGITVGQTSESTMIPTLYQLAAMQGEIDPSYSETDSQPVYMVSPAMRIRLLQQLADDGRRTYPEISEGKLLGFPLVQNVAMSADPGGIGVVFGSVKRGVFIHSTPQILVRSVELKAEFFQTYFALFHRLGAVLQDSNALTALQLASS